MVTARAESWLDDSDADDEHSLAAVVGLCVSTGDVETELDVKWLDVDGHGEWELSGSVSVTECPFATKVQP